MDIFLAQLFGLYFVVVGIVVLVRRKSLVPAVSALRKDKSLMMIMGALELMGGLALVLAYPVVEFSPVGLISLLGYVLAIEGLLYLGGNAIMQQAVRNFNTKKWYIIVGIVSVVMGVYLLDYGFAFGFF